MKQSFQQWLNDYNGNYPRLPKGLRNRYIYALFAGVFGLTSIMGYPFLMMGPSIDISSSLLFALAISLSAAILWPRGKRPVWKMLFTVLLVGFVGSYLFAILMTLEGAFSDAAMFGRFELKRDDIVYVLKFGTFVFLMGWLVSFGTSYVFGCAISALFADDRNGQSLTSSQNPPF